MDNVCNGFGLKGILTTDCASYCHDFCIWDYQLEPPCASESCYYVRSANGKTCKNMGNVSATIEGIGVMNLPSYYGQVNIYSSRNTNQTPLNLTIFEYAFRNALAAEWLVIADVNLTDIPGNALPASLRYFMITNVPMGKVPAALHQSTNLEWLALRDVGFTNLQFQNNMSFLRYLDVSYNNIQEFNLSLPSLVELNLTSTGLSRIPKSIFTMPTLRNIDLSKNFAAGTSMYQILPNSTHEERAFLLNENFTVELGDEPLEDCCMLTSTHYPTELSRFMDVSAQCTSGKSLYRECVLEPWIPTDWHFPISENTLLYAYIILGQLCMSILIGGIFYCCYRKCTARSRRLALQRTALGLTQTRDTMTDCDDQASYVAERNETIEHTNEEDLLSPYRIPYESVVLTTKISANPQIIVWQGLYLNENARVIELCCIQNKEHISTLHQKVVHLCEIQHKSLSTVHGVAYYSPIRLFVVFENPTLPTLPTQIPQGTNTWDTRKHSIALQISHTIQYLHDSNSYHGNAIHSQNVFITLEDTVQLRHPIFQYPANLQNDDTYQFGLILYELATNQLLLETLPSIPSIKYTLSNSVDCPIHIQQLILDCLTSSLKIQRIVGILDQNICSLHL